MGYYSEYQIEASEEIIKALSEVSGYRLYSSNDEIKWYDWEEDCRAVSKMFPDETIEVARIGEEFPDMEIGYFRNGVGWVGSAEIHWPTFEELVTKGE